MARSLCPLILLTTLCFPALSQEPAAELRQLVTSWASAWQSQNIEAYFAFYHPSFQPDGFSSREAWQAERRERLGRPGYIRISLKDFEVMNQEESEAVVRFWLSYARPDYGDQTWKELRLVRDGGSWSIASERNLEVKEVRRN